MSVMGVESEASSAHRFVRRASPPPDSAPHSISPPHPPPPSPPLPSPSQLEAARAAAVPITVTLPDGSTQVGTAGVSTPMDIAKAVGPAVAKSTVVAKVRGAEREKR